MENRITREEAKIDLKCGGKLTLGLRCYEREYGKYVYQDRVEWLGFDENDVHRSKEVLQGSRQLSFEVWATIPDSYDLIAYLGDPSPGVPWESKLAIPLKHQTSQNDWKRWWVGSEDESKRVQQLRVEYWRAAEAKVHLFQRRGEDRIPLWRPDGSIVSTVIRLDYEPEYRSLYENVLKDMERLTVQGDLASNFNRYVDFKNIRDRREDTAGLELYKRLINVFPRYKETVLQILRRPDLQYEQAVQQNFFSLGEALSHFSGRGRYEPITRVYQAEKKGSQVIPTKFASHRTSLNVDTPANRYVAGSLARIQKGVRLIKKHLYEEKKSSKEFMTQERAKAFDHKHDQAILHLEEVQKEVEYLIGRQPWPSALSLNEAPVSSMNYYDGRYSRLRELTSLMETLLEFVNTSEDAFPFEVQAFHKLYQHWVFIHVIEAMSSLGFKFVDEDGRRTTPFYKNPFQNDVNCRLVSPYQEQFVIEVFYERCYESASDLERGAKKGSNHRIEKLDRPYGLENRFPGKTRSRSKKNRPDIVFERHECKSDFTRKPGSVPEIITLDPTLAHSGTRDSAWDKKYEYEESIRSFVETNEQGRSKRIVKAAWGVSPGLRRGQSPFVELFEKQNYRFGFICLRPTDDHIEELQVTLRKVLRYAGWVGD